jgi:hypothetical protein
MTFLLDIAAVLALAAALTAAPLAGVRHDVRIDRQLRKAQHGPLRD